MPSSFKKIIILTLVILALPLFSYGQELRDAIGIRVMKNPDFLSPSTWYLENVPSPGKAKSTQIDGYEAVIDGRSVYVEATRVDEGNGLTEAYIFIMSYNEGGGTAIVNIFTQLLDNWNFNSNINSNDICDKVDSFGDIPCSSDFDCIVESVDYGPCLSQKGKLRRDIKRVADLQDLKKELEQYALSNSSYPSLAQGTYIPRYSTSKWPSWGQTLSRDLGINLPQDPLNRFYNDCSDLTGYHPDTCWNEDVKSFECPSGASTLSTCLGGANDGSVCVFPADCPGGVCQSNNVSSYLYVYSAKGICSLHCDALSCLGGANDTLSCDEQADCPGGVCKYDLTCTQNSDCPDAGEYCMKVNGVIDIQFNLETDKDATISTNYPLALGAIGAAPSAGGICSDSSFWALEPVSFTDIDCCPPMDCTTMGLSGYTCGTYINNCGESIDCGACGGGESCINGSCCTPDCTGKICGDDGCGGSCGSCPSGEYCDINYTCQEGCVNACAAGAVRCNPGNEWIQSCGNCDLDSCDEWCDIANCAVNPLAPYCNDDGTIAICGECIDADTQPCGVSSVGECSFGTQDCDMGVWDPTCTGGVLPGVEACNGLDDNCDGIPDNIPAGTLPVDPENDGVCNGYFQDCVGGTPSFDPSSIPNFQTPETLCDYLDNDCDGTTDENQPNLGAPCTSGGMGECTTNGVYVCDISNPNGPATCSASAPNTPQPEICDGLDNDCDGTIDNNLTDLAPLKDNQIGVCFGETKTCTSIVNPLCSPADMPACWSNDYFSIPEYENPEVTCDGLDNDCDGLTDGEDTGTFGNWGLGCYLDENGDGDGDEADECQKGKVRCDLSGEYCHNVYEDPLTTEYVTYSGTPMFDQCCRLISDGIPYDFSGVSVIYPGTDYSCLYDGCDGAAFVENGNNNLNYIQGWGSGFFNELTLAGAQDGGCGGLCTYNYYAYNCDEVCNRRGGKVCVGSGLGLTSQSCVKINCDSGANCHNIGNLTESACKDNFHIWQGWTCRDFVGSHTFPVMSSACYCM